MNVKTKSRIFVFVLSLIVYLGLTSFTDIQELIAGVIIALFVSLLAGHLLITTEKKGHPFKRFGKAIVYLCKFIWEMAKANFHVAYLVLHPKVPIKPGIIKINTKLTKDAAITALTNSITLTPGTLTVDVNPDTKEIYIHWIDVKEQDVKLASKLIVDRFEKILTKVFEE